MKKILFAALMAIMSFAFASCQGGEDKKLLEDVLLEVTAYNIAGEWKLSTWRGEPLAEGS